MPRSKAIQAKIVEAKNFMILPPHPSLCQTCGYKHDPHLPHNPSSLYWQTKFNIDHGRAPTWTDALEHCSPEIKQAWERMLAQQGSQARA